MCLYNKYKYRLLNSSFLFIARHYSVVWVAPQLAQPFTCCHFYLHVCACLWGPEVSSSVLPHPHPFAHWFSKPSQPASPRHPPVHICPWARRLKKHQPTSLLHGMLGSRTRIFMPAKQALSWLSHLLKYSFSHYFSPEWGSLISWGEGKKMVCFPAHVTFYQINRIPKCFGSPNQSVQVHQNRLEKTSLKALSTRGGEVHRKEMGWVCSFISQWIAPILGNSWKQ